MQKLLRNKLMKKKIFQLLFFLINLSIFKAQSISQFTKSALDASNIHENEGLANINIPIAELSIRDYILSINANYNSKGVKINFESGEIGQNWDLSHKGIITRSIWGLADEQKFKVHKSPYYGFFQNGTAYVKCYDLVQSNEIGLLYNLQLIKNNVTKFFNNPNQVNGYVGLRPTKFNYSDYYTLQKVDTSSDIFTVIIPGRNSFKFYFDLEGQIQSESDENYKIEYNLDNYSYFKSFTLIDEQGIKFVFNNMETVKQATESNMQITAYGDELPPKVVSPRATGDTSIPYCDPSSPSLQYYFDKIPVSWYLSKIENKYGEQINYNYESKKALSVDLTTRENALSHVPITFSSHINEIPVIKSISTNVSSLKYNYQETRKDFFNFNKPNHTSIERLSSISSFYGNEKRKTVLFDTDYVVSNQAVGLSLSDVELAVYRRLFLKRIVFLDSEGTFIDNYLFQYKNPELLPHRQSAETDFWGYYRNNSQVYNYSYKVISPSGFPDTILSSLQSRGTPKLYSYMSGGLNNRDHNYFSIYKRGGSYSESYSCFDNDYSVLLSGTCPKNDLTPILADTSLGLLTNILHQGSNVSIDYELNYFSYYNLKREGPGTRVKTIKTNDGLKEIINEFKYGENEDGIGYIDRLSSVGNYYRQTSDNGFIRTAGGPSLNNIMDNTIFYKKVKSIKRDNLGNNNGYTINTYSLFDIVNNDNVTIDGFTYQSNRNNIYMVTPDRSPDSPNTKYVDDYYSTPYSIPETDLSKVNGKIIKREVYNNSNNLIESTEYDYQLKWKELNRIYIWDNSSLLFFHPKGGGVGRFYFFNYLPRKIETSSFFNNGTLKNTVNYLYNSKNKISEINKKIGEETEKTEIKYMYEGNTMEGAKLKLQNRLNEVEESISTNNKGGITKIKNTYKEFSVSNNINVIENTKEEKSIDDVNYFSNEEITLVGAQGNIIERKLNNSSYITTIWGYHQTKPIAEIQGAKYSDLMTELGLDPTSNTSYLQLDIVEKSNLDIDHTSEELLITTLDSFRKSLSKYLVTTYTYNPLMGVTSTTTPNGIRETYTYDFANRLEKVVDNNGKLIKEYNYNHAQFRYFNIAKNKSFVRNNCGYDAYGSTYNYIVPANKYISIINQADADQQAQNDIDINGQDAANMYGVCDSPAFCSFMPENDINDVTSTIERLSDIKVKVQINIPISINGLNSFNSSLPFQGFLIGEIADGCQLISNSNQLIAIENGRKWIVTMGINGSIFIKLIEGGISPSSISAGSINLNFEYNINDANSI